MKKDTIPKKQSISSIEKIPKSSAIFQRFGQINVILHGKSAGFPTHKFQRELQGALADSVEADVFGHLKEVTCQTLSYLTINVAISF